MRTPPPVCIAEIYLGCIRMPASRRIDSAFMYELPSSSTAREANSVAYPRRWGNSTSCGQLGLERLGALARSVDGRVDQPREDGVDPDADHGQVTGHREGQATMPPLEDE